MSKNKNNVVVARQGDVSIIRVQDDVKVGAPVKLDKGRIVLAYGEVTGHAHAIRDVSAELFELDEDRSPDGDDAWLRADRLLRVKKTVTLRHEEHGAIALAPGTYRIRIQREYSPEALRNVAD